MSKNKTITKKFLTEIMAKTLKEKDVKFTMEQLGELTVALLAQIKDLADKGESVNIQGFGVFRVKETKPRNGRNPITGETIMIESRRVLKFYPSRVLRQRLNKIDRFM